jgi:hypothetical protein
MNLELGDESGSLHAVWIARLTSVYMWQETGLLRLDAGSVKARQSGGRWMGIAVVFLECRASSENMCNVPLFISARVLATPLFRVLHWGVLLQLGCLLPRAYRAISFVPTPPSHFDFDYHLHKWRAFIWFGEACARDGQASKPSVAKKAADVIATREASTK